MKQYYIKIKGEPIPVTEKIYRAYKRPVWREKKNKEVRAEREVSYDVMVEIGREPEDKSQERVDKIVVEKLFLEKYSKLLPKALAELDEDEKFLIDEIYFKKQTERDISDMIGISCVAVHKRKKKILKKLKIFLEKF